MATSKSILEYYKQIPHNSEIFFVKGCYARDIFSSPRGALEITIASFHADAMNSCFCIKLVWFDGSFHIFSNGTQFNLEKSSFISIIDKLDNAFKNHKRSSTFCSLCQGVLISAKEDEEEKMLVASFSHESFLENKGEDAEMKKVWQSFAGKIVQIVMGILCPRPAHIDGRNFFGEMRQECNRTARSVWRARDRVGVSPSCPLQGGASQHGQKPAK